jgi:MOSC domain-containing protein YiiM
LPDNPTLGAVRGAMVSGLTARLLADGIVEADDEQTLLAEIDRLIEHHGEDAVAETFIRYE